MPDYMKETLPEFASIYFEFEDTTVSKENPQYSFERLKEQSPDLLTICIEKKKQTVSNKFFYGGNIIVRPIFKENDDVNLTSSVVDEINEEELLVYDKTREKIIWQGVNISDLSQKDQEFVKSFVGTIDLNENFRKEDLNITEEILNGNFTDKT